MAYLALARKWRPQTFESISGQEHVTRTLMNAIEQDRVHHAFLFCGARGVGKTTAARVLARALNCVNGPTQTPCGECKACGEIASSSSIDVLEIDGASNRGISEIRELRESVAYAPQRDRTKIYIIDEVHMLTTEAFNALLKTLEEPPSHVKFIFATTEPQKIPVTILSRCQRFDFKRIGQEEMLDSLRGILKEEGVTIDDGGLRLVARESEGSMRDALSLLDRIISFCGQEADVDQISQVLGVADRRWIDLILAAALSGDSPAALDVIADVFEYGTDLRHFTRDLVRSLRDMVVLRVAPESPHLTDLSDIEREQHLKRIADHAPQRLQQLFQLALDTSERLAQTSFPRLELEMAIVRMCHVRPLKGIDGLVQRLGALERRLGGAPPPPPVKDGKSRPFDPPAPAPAPAPELSSPSPPSAPVEAPPAVPKAQGRPSPPEPVVRASEVAVVAVETLSHPLPAPEPVAVVAEPTPSPESLVTAPVEEQVPAVEPVAVNKPEERLGGDSEVGSASAESTVASSPSSKSDSSAKVLASSDDEHVSANDALKAVASVSNPFVTPAPAKVKRKGSSLSHSSRPSRDMFAEGSDIGTLDHEGWDSFVDRLQNESLPWAASLEHAELQRVDKGKVIIAFEKGSANLERVEEHGRDLLRFLKKDFVNVTGLGIDEVKAIEHCPYRRRLSRVKNELGRRRDVLGEHRVVTQFVDRFDAQVAQVRVYGEEKYNEH
jgi:DNA polymerase-3 subunit gamma/tau